MKRTRWLALPLAAGILLWANTASYDLRNVLGLLMISAFVPLYAIARPFVKKPDFSNQRRWRVPDGAAAAGVAALCVVLTLPLAMGDEKLKQRFANEQLEQRIGD